MTNTRTKQKERTLYIILAAALAARLLLALVTEGYTYDMSCFVAWGDKLASEGPAAFYSADYFAEPADLAGRRQPGAQGAPTEL